MGLNNFIIILITISSLCLHGCIKDEAVKLAYKGYQPVSIGDGWQISTPSMENMDEDYLNTAFQLVHNNDRFMMARSLLILRNGKLVAESYPNDTDDANRIENIQSCTKSFTSILTGIALEKGYLDSLNQTFSEIYPDYFINHQDKKSITIANALTMKTGINFIDGDNTRPLYETDKSSIDGITFGAVSIFMKPRDIAKFGQLLLQNGKWRDKQIVDSTWIAEATKPIVTMHSPGSSYGYYFWIFPAYGGYAAVGHGGQFLFVVPSKKLVVIYTAWPYTSGDMFDNFNELADLIIKSCKPLP